MRKALPRALLFGGFPLVKQRTTTLTQQHGMQRRILFLVYSGYSPEQLVEAGQGKWETGLDGLDVCSLQWQVHSVTWAIASKDTSYHLIEDPRTRRLTGSMTLHRYDTLANLCKGIIQQTSRRPRKPAQQHWIVVSNTHVAAPDRLIASTDIWDTILYHWDIWGAIPAQFATPPLPDARIYHLSQLEGCIDVLRFCAERKQPHSRFSLATLKELVPKAKIVAYFMVAMKSARFHRAGVFNSSVTLFYVPLFCHPSGTLRAQLDSLSVQPDVLLFKVSDCLASLGQPKFAAIARELQEIEHHNARLHPRMYLPARLETQYTLIDRFHFTDLLAAVANRVNRETGTEAVCVPRYVKCTSLHHVNARTLSFPVVCKGRLGGGPPVSHAIGFALNPEGLLEFASVMHQQWRACKRRGGDSSAVPAALRYLDVPSGILIQEFVNGGREPVLKVFVLRNRIFIGTQRYVPHPSQAFSMLQDLARKEALHSSQNCVVLNSSVLKQPEGAIQRSLRLTAPDGSAFEGSSNPCSSVGGHSSGVLAAIDKPLCRLTALLQHALRTPLFGFDVILLRNHDKDRNGGSTATAASCRLAVVDVNYFPSYNGVPHLREALGSVLQYYY